MIAPELASVKPALIYFTVCLDVPIGDVLASKGDLALPSPAPANIVLVCRRGNDSQRALVALRSHFASRLSSAVCIRDIAGGLHAWAREVDPAFPVY